jgi:hypothetical protein
MFGVFVDPLDGDSARFGVAGQLPHEVQPTQVLFHLGRRPLGVARADEVKQAPARAEDDAIGGRSDWW